MFRRFTKKRVGIGLAAVAALALAAGAYAYLSTTGSGSGSGTVTATNTPMTLSASGSSLSSDSTTNPIPALTKLGDSETFYIWATQSTNPQETATVTTTVTPKDSGCPAGSFTLGSAGFSAANAVHQVNTAVEVPAGAGTTKIGSDVVYFNDDTSADQTACKSGYTLSFATP